MPDRYRRQAELVERYKGVAANGEDKVRLEKLHQSIQHRSARSALGFRVAAVGQRLARQMRMEGEHVPKKGRLPDPCQHVPDNGCGSLRDRLTTSRLRQAWGTKQV